MDEVGSRLPCPAFMNRLLAGIAVGDPLPHARSVAALGGAPRPQKPEIVEGHIEYAFDHKDGLVRVYSDSSEEGKGDDRLVTCVTIQRTSLSDGSAAIQSSYDATLDLFTRRYGARADVREETVGTTEIIRHRWIFEGLAATIQFDCDDAEPSYLLVKLENSATGF